MTAMILAILKSLLEAASKIAELFGREKDREAGRNEVLLKEAQDALENQKIADEVDREPVPSDKSAVLDKLRDPAGDRK